MVLLDTIKKYFESGRRVIIIKSFFSGGISPRWPGKVVFLSDFTKGKSKYITALHEFLHLDCMYSDEHRCSVRPASCMDCPCEDEIDKEAKKIYWENGEEVNYLRLMMARKHKQIYVPARNKNARTLCEQLYFSFY